MEIESKSTQRKITGIGNIEVTILQVGETWYLKEIDTFLSSSDDSFCVLAMTQKPELRDAVFFQRALQAFINHIQSGSEKQTANLMRAHFRNWINRMPSQNFKSIINGTTTNSTNAGFGANGKQTGLEALLERGNQKFAAARSKDRSA